MISRIQFNSFQSQIKACSLKPSLKIVENGRSTEEFLGRDIYYSRPTVLKNIYLLFLNLLIPNV
jgi:hypothetical protein